ncbi:hypothetical protein F2Q69_00061346 [Brassica cretica]|uniref:CCHC-type domain-containing protein n=1 Tax=Brassica cretica TaxID=69181 RepID=A0A8S9RKK9_BRACR|nr:hypothetical protein F2Q69_00061346 [Brassica cretica]
MRVEIRNRCRVVTYYRLGDLVEKAAEQEAGLAEEQKLFKSAQTKVGKTLESQKRTLDELEPPSFPGCKRNHYGECIRLLNPERATMDFINCGQPGHIFRDCPRREHAEDSPPPKRQAINQ